MSALVSLGLGIGANTAIFQLLDAVRLRSLPVQNPHELAEVRIAGGHQGMFILDNEYAALTRPVWQEIRKNQQAFSGIFAWVADEVNIGQGSEMRRVKSISVSGDYFRVLGVRPWRGRLIAAEDEGACPESKAVVSYFYWLSQLGGAEIGPGSTIVVDGERKQIIGVTPPDFFGLAVGDRFDVALPFCQPKELPRNVFDTVVMGRLRPGWTLERASAQLQAISAAIFEKTAPKDYNAPTIETYKRFRLGAFAAAAGVSSLRTQYDSSLWLLLAITGLVLLIACANLANLMLARASTREREMAVRLALGASRARLLRQLLMESALLAGMGAAAGMGVAQLLSRVLVRALSTGTNPVELSIATDWRVLLFTAAAAALTCIIFGVAPARRAANTAPMNAIKTGSRERFSLQRVIVVTQIAVSLVLLIGALLFVRSFRKLMTLDPGMREAHITVATVAFPKRYADFKRRLLEEVRATPGVLSAASTTIEPLLGGGWEHAVHVGAAEGPSKFTWVSPGYFETMAIPLIAGRDFNQQDTAASQRVAVVNQTFARHFLGSQNPIGKTLRTEPEPGYPSTIYKIVGIVPDTKYGDLRSETPPMAFAPASQFPAPDAATTLMIYSNMPSAAVLATVKRRIAEKHPEVATTAGFDFQTAIRDTLVRERLMAMLSGFFGLLAAALAMVGLYGVISYMVAQRRNEIGIRMALGAQRPQVIAMIMREACRLLAIGIPAGTALALVAGRAVESLLFQLKPHDPLTLAAAGTLLAAVAALASFLPAHRASKLEPTITLRHE